MDLTDPSAAARGSARVVGRSAARLRSIFSMEWFLSCVMIRVHCWRGEKYYGIVFKRTCHGRCSMCGGWMVAKIETLAKMAGRNFGEEQVIKMAGKQFRRWRRPRSLDDDNRREVVVLPNLSNVESPSSSNVFSEAMKQCRIFNSCWFEILLQQPPHRGWRTSAVGGWWVIDTAASPSLRTTHSIQQYF